MTRYQIRSKSAPYWDSTRAAKKIAMTTGTPRNSSMIDTTNQRVALPDVIRHTASSVPTTSEKNIANAAAIRVFFSPLQRNRHRGSNWSSFGSSSGAHFSHSSWPVSSSRRMASAIKIAIATSAIPPPINARRRAPGPGAS